MEIQIEYSPQGYDSKDYYETNHVQKGKSNYTCEFCGKGIGVGNPSAIHKFYPEFSSVRTHTGECENGFINKLHGKGTLYPITRPEQEEAKNEIIACIEEKVFFIHECLKTKDQDKLVQVIEDDLIEVMEDRDFDSFEFQYKTKLNYIFKAEVHDSNLTLNFENEDN